MSPYSKTLRGLKSLWTLCRETLGWWLLCFMLVSDLTLRCWRRDVLDVDNVDDEEEEEEEDEDEVGPPDM
jgi:hypothetical protein